MNGHTVTIGAFKSQFAKAARSASLGFYSDPIHLEFGLLRAMAAS